MSHESTSPFDEVVGSASVGNAGEPTHADQASDSRADQAPPSAQELDEREARMTRPRKPMGPQEIPESVPEEP